MQSFFSLGRDNYIIIGFRFAAKEMKCRGQTTGGENASQGRFRRKDIRLLRMEKAGGFQESLVARRRLVELSVHVEYESTRGMHGRNEIKAFYSKIGTTLACPARIYCTVKTHLVLTVAFGYAGSGLETCRTTANSARTRRPNQDF